MLIRIIIIATCESEPILLVKFNMYLLFCSLLMSALFCILFIIFFRRLKNDKSLLPVSTQWCTIMRMGFPARYRWNDVDVYRCCSADKMVKLLWQCCSLVPPPRILLCALCPRDICRLNNWCVTPSLINPIDLVDSVFSHHLFHWVARNFVVRTGLRRLGVYLVAKLLSLTNGEMVWRLLECTEITY